MFIQHYSRIPLHPGTNTRSHTLVPWNTNFLPVIYLFVPRISISLYPIFLYPRTPMTCYFQRPLYPAIMTSLTLAIMTSLTLATMTSLTLATMTSLTLATMTSLPLATMTCGGTNIWIHINIVLLFYI